MCYAPALGICTQTCSIYTTNGKSVEIDNIDAEDWLVLSGKCVMSAFIAPGTLTIGLQVQYTTVRPRSSRKLWSAGYISSMGAENTKLCMSDRLHLPSTRDRRSPGLDDASFLRRPTIMAASTFLGDKFAQEKGYAAATPPRGPTGERGKRCL